MEITDELIHKLAQLGKLQVAEEELPAMRADLQRMLDFVGVLRELDTQGVEPLIHLSRAMGTARPDRAEAALDREAMIKQAPEAEAAFFKVPRVVKR
ncbi:MAG: Asp-tRNA(Asn)/Glu-tRNA(Gln) amidotransferase subunit GatC [Bacteroidota bacterium]